MTIIDTPDYQRGVVNAQRLLAVVPGDTQQVSVSLPPNAETLIVLTPPASGGGEVTVTGADTGVLYRGADIGAVPGVGGGSLSYFDIAGAVDETVTVAWSLVPPNQWWVLSDSGVHIVANMYGKRDTTLASVVTTVPPSGNANDGPVNELQCAAGFIAASGVVMSAPGSGIRYRVFAAQLVSIGGTVYGSLNDEGNVRGFIVAGPSGAGNLTFGPSGIPCAANGTINLFINGGSGTFLWSVTYTTEEV